MIELDGIQYNIDDAETNADAILKEANEYAEAKQLTDKNGERIVIEKNWANPLYLFAYGVGALFSYVQRLLYSAACGLNLAESSERQLLNIADIAGVQRREASVTTINGVAFATEDGACTIRTTDLCKVSTTSGIVNFYPAYDVTIAAGGSAVFILVAKTKGSFSIPENTVQFETPPTNLRRITTAASVPGQEEESIAAFRRRLARRAQAASQLDLAQDSIASLPGVSTCSIIFNKSIQDNLTVGDVTIPPRQAALYVQGYSADIAKTFYRHMDCRVVQTEGCLTQTYVAKNGQSFPVYIIPPLQTPVYVRVYSQDDLEDEAIQKAKDTIMLLSATLTVGTTLTSTNVVDALQQAYGDTHWDGCVLSLDGNSYSYKAVPRNDALLTFNASNIDIVVGE